MIKRFFVKLFKFFFSKPKKINRESRLANIGIRGYFKGIKDSFNNEEKRLKQLNFYDLEPTHSSMI